MKIKYLIISLLFLLILNIATVYNYNSYVNNLNDKIILITEKIIETNPSFEEEIIKILKSDEIVLNETLKKYGYLNDSQFLISSNEKSLYFNMFYNSVTFIILSLLIFIVLVIHDKKRNTKISKLVSYLEEINNQNYNLELDTNNEDELSKLKNEIYKTTVYLKNYSIKLKEEKSLLKNNLTDISHQLKTPLTSINIMLENLIENDNINNDTKKEFLTDIKTQTDHINTLVKSLLVLSKFDADIVIFKKETINLQKLVNKVLNNLKPIYTAKKIVFKVEISENITFSGDYNWQLEAITNIIKNSIEHSHSNGIIEIKSTTNSICTKLIIKDYGEGILKKDIKKIFDRFYKSSNKNDGIGVGLNLAKTIIEKDNGIITLKSEYKKYTSFEIRYMN